jgi:hypothetical protein
MFWIVIIIVAVLAYLAGCLTPLLWMRHEARRDRERRERERTIVRHSLSGSTDEHENTLQLLRPAGSSRS